MPDKITLVRGDGTLLDATPEQASKLALLGYKEVTAGQNAQRLAAEGAEDYYTSPGQKLQAAAEGLSSGLSFGASDYLLGDDDTKSRAAYNPGTRLASETLGALLPMFLTGGESATLSLGRGAEEAGAVSKLASVAPTSLLSDAARALAPGEGLGAAVARGAIEGGVYGGAGAANHAYLDGEPITAETILHGIGWGAVIGGALGGAGKAVEQGAESALARREAAALAEKPPIPQGALNTLAGAEYGALRDELSNLGMHIKDATRVADLSFDEVTQALKRADTTEFSTFAKVKFAEDAARAQELYQAASKAAEAGKFQAAQKAIDEYSTHVSQLGQRVGIELPDPGKALGDLTAMRALSRVFDSAPKSIETFATMSAPKFEQFSAAISQIDKLPVTSGAQEAVNNLVKAMGLDGSVSRADDGLRAAWKSAKSVFKSEGKMPEKAPEPQVSTTRRIVGYAAGAKTWLAARAAGLGKVGSYTAYRTVKDGITYGGQQLVGIKAAALAHIRDAAAEWGPSVGRTMRKASGPSSLAITLFGEQDKGTTDRAELAKRRAAEIANFAPVAKDAIFKAVEPLAVTQPMLAPAIHKAALQAFQAMQVMTPRDPGAVSGLKSIWKPGDVATSLFEKQWSVFQDPVGEAARMLKSGDFDAVKVQALKTLAPNVWGDMRVSLLERISQPGVLQKTSYRDQIALSVLLDLPVHTSMMPGYIATSQQMFLDRNQGTPANPRIGQGGGIPNPTDGLETAAQKSTER